MANVSLLATVADQTASQIAGATSALLPSGVVLPFAGSSAPSGWLICDGTEYSKTGVYANLFAFIGITYGETNGSGGVGTTHFRVPNCQGIFIAGVGTQTVGGKTYTKTLGSKQSESTSKNGLTVTNNAVTSLGMSANASHSHSDNGHAHSGTGLAFGADGSGNTALGASGVGFSWGVATGYASISSTNIDHTHSITSNVTLNAGDTETRPANIAMNYIIKV